MYAPLFCTAIRLRCSEYFAAKHTLVRYRVVKSPILRKKFQCFCSEQTAYHGLELLTGINYNQNGWEIVDATVIRGDATVERVKKNTALLIFFGNVHCALIVEDIFVQSYYDYNGGFPARAVPHDTEMPLCELAGMSSLAMEDTELLYITVDPQRVAIYAEQLPAIQTLSLHNSTTTAPM